MLMHCFMALVAQVIFGGNNLTRGRDYHLEKDLILKSFIVFQSADIIPMA